MFIIDRELMQMALEFCEDIGELGGPYPYVNGTGIVYDSRQIAKALRERLAQPEPEPVAWFIQYEYRHEFLWREPTAHERNSALEIKPLYPAPPKREWVGLTDGDIAKTMHGSVEGSNMLPYQFARAIEAKLKEKNT